MGRISLFFVCLVVIGWVNSEAISCIRSSSLCSSTQNIGAGKCITLSDGSYCDCFSGCGGPLPEGLFPSQLQLENLERTFFPPQFSYSLSSSTIGITVTIPSFPVASRIYKRDLKVQTSLKFGTTGLSSCDFPYSNSWTVFTWQDEAKDIWMDTFKGSFDIETFKNCGMTRVERGTFNNTLTIERMIVLSQGKYNFHRRFITEKRFEVTFPSVTFSTSSTEAQGESIQKRNTDPSYYALLGNIEFDSVNDKWNIQLNTLAVDPYQLQIASSFPSTIDGREFDLKTSPGECQDDGNGNCAQISEFTYQGCQEIGKTFDISYTLVCRTGATGCTAPDGTYDILLELKAASSCDKSAQYSDNKGVLIAYGSDTRSDASKSKSVYGTSEDVWFQIKFDPLPPFFESAEVGSICAYPITEINNDKESCFNFKGGIYLIDSSNVNTDTVSSSDFHVAFHIKAGALRAAAKVDSLQFQVDAKIDYDTAKRNIGGLSKTISLVISDDIAANEVPEQRLVQKYQKRNEIQAQVESFDPSPASTLFLSFATLLVALLLAF